MRSSFLSSPEVANLVRAGLWLALITGGCWFLTQIQVTLTIFALAWLIAYLMRPLITRLEGRRLGPIHECSRGVAVSSIYLVLLAVLIFLGSLAFPTVSSQFNRLLDLQHTLYHPQELAHLIQQQGERMVNAVPEQYREKLLERLQASVGSISLWIGEVFTSGLSHLAAFLGQLAAGAAIFLSATLISVYLVFSWEGLFATVTSACPARYREDIIQLLARMNQIFGGYLRATIVTSLLNGACTLAALTIYSWFTGRPCPYAHVISLVATLTYPIPLFGILTSLLSALLFGFVGSNDLTTAIGVAVVSFLVSIVIDRTIQPKLMGDAIGVSPVFVIFAAAAGGEFLGGVWGMLLGIPLAAMLKALLLWFHDQFLVDPRGVTPATEQPPPPEMAQ